MIFISFFEPPPVCSIHLDNVTKAPEQRRRISHTPVFFFIVTIVEVCMMTVDV